MGPCAGKSKKVKEYESTKLEQKQTLRNHTNTNTKYKSKHQAPCRRSSVARFVSQSSFVYDIVCPSVRRSPVCVVRLALFVVVGAFVRPLFVVAARRRLLSVVRLFVVCQCVVRVVCRSRLCVSFAFRIPYIVK